MFKLATSDLESGQLGGFRPGIQVDERALIVRNNSISPSDKGLHSVDHALSGVDALATERTADLATWHLRKRATAIRTDSGLVPNQDLERIAKHLHTLPHAIHLSPAKLPDAPPIQRRIRWEGRLSSRRNRTGRGVSGFARL